MKHVVCIVGMCILSAFALTAKAAKVSDAFRRALVKGAQSKVVVRVCDDDGVPVRDAEVIAAIAKGVDEYSIHGTTDINGKWILEGDTTGNYIQISVRKSGYYDSMIKFSYINMGEEHEVKDGKWQPYGERKDIRLRKVSNPCCLASIEKWIDVPCTNTWIAFDMQAGDFVSPFGSGTAEDFEVWVEWDGLSGYACRKCLARIRFAKEGCGGYFLDKIAESAYPFCYHANTNAMLSTSFGTVNRNGDFMSTHKPFPENQYYVARTRCVIDERGNIQQANYGYIRWLDVFPTQSSRARINYSGVFNPTPNDTNLEPKRERRR